MDAEPGEMDDSHEMAGPTLSPPDGNTEFDLILSMQHGKR